MPKPGRFADGPVWPNPLTRARTSRGFTAESSSQPSPHRSSVPGRKFSSTTSDRLREPEEELGALRRGEIERDEALVSGERLEPQSGAVLARAVAARRIDARRMLDLDHVGAEVAEEHSGQRRREERGRFDDSDPGERLRHRSTARRKPMCGERASPPPSSSSFSE